MKIDKKQIKVYSKEITKACKLYGYDPSEEYFWDFFDDASDFYFIPYIKELAKNASDDDDDFMEKLGYAIDEAYNPAIEVTLDEVEDYIKKNNISLGKFLNNEIENRDIELEFILDWLLSHTNDEIIQKFINWVLE